MISDIQQQKSNLSIAAQKPPTGRTHQDNNKKSAPKGA